MFLIESQVSYNFDMNKCQHGQKITTFCATESCQYKEAGGCDLCIKKYHSHLAHCSFLSQQQVHALMRKFAVDNSIKPKCRILQQSIYNYFTELKTEITNSLDTVCKNMINQIGYPYLSATNTLNAFKRLKNKEYKKLTQKEFKHFIEVVSKIEDKDLIKQQNKIYQLQMKNTNEILTQLQALVKNYEGIVKEYHNAFVHEPANFQKVNEIVKNIGNQSPYKLARKGIEAKQRDLAQNKHSKDIPKINIITTPFTSLDSKTESNLKSQKNYKMDDIDHQTLSPLALLPPKIQRTRDVSLDKKINPRQSKSNQEQQKGKDFQKSETKLPNQKIEHLKQELNNKQIQINQKKKLLLDIMKPNQKIERPLQRLQLMVGSPVKGKYNEYAASKKQHLKTEDKSANQSKSSKSSQDLSQFQEQGSKANENTKNYAFAKLPIEDLTSNKQEKQEIKNRLIIIPTDIDKKSFNQRKGSEMESPLYKKRQAQNKIQSKVKEQVRQKSQSLYKKLEGDSKMKETLELKQNQEKSLALLMKSLAMNAENAIIYLQASLRYAENNISAVEYLSYLYLEQNRPKDCLMICNKTIDKIEDSKESQLMLINIMNNKAAALNILGRYSEAILIIERALKCKQRDNLYKNLGDSYFSIGMHEKAIFNYEKSLKLNSNNDECSYNLAACLYIQQNFINSKLAISRALQIQPKNDLYMQLKGKIDEKIKAI